ncbi:hypothetical protein EON62_00950 [archaeon]|nr:MAG: hypothetical protein EON62_00950 [archaeon]
MRVRHAVATAPVEELKAQGATVAATPAAAAANVEAVVTMLPSSPHVREVRTHALACTQPSHGA